jgi:hypothetical protein
LLSRTPDKERISRPRRACQHHKIMKTLEKLTLATATAATATALGISIRQYLRVRSERVFRLAAGESPYERRHPKPRHA